jgi:hypothetical protein
VSALEILAAALLVLGSFVVFRVLLEAYPFVDAGPLDASPPEAEEEAPPLRRAA